MALINQPRELQDPNFTTSAAFPAAAGADVLTSSLDLTQSDAASDHFWAQIDVPALPNNITSSISVAVSLYHSDAPASGFALIPEISPLLIPGVATTGSAAATQQVKLPPETKQYIAANLHVPTGGGNNTATSATLSLRF